MSGIKINFLDNTRPPQALTTPANQNMGYLPLFNFTMPDFGFMPTFGSSSNYFDNFEQIFANALKMMEINVPKPEIKSNIRPLDYNRTNNNLAPDNSTKIAQLKPEMQAKTMDLIDYAKNQLGKEIKITSGFRTKEQQEYLIKTTPHLAANRSAHCEGKAVDLNIIGGSDEDYKKLGDYAVSIGMRWGGNFSKTPERWHFDYQWG